MFEKVAIGFLLSFIIVMVVILLVLIFSGEQPPVLGSCMTTPEGYEYSGVVQKWTGDYAYKDVMVCRNLETGVYRECVVEFVECEQ